MVKIPMLFICLACAGLAMAAKPAGAAFFPMDPELLVAGSSDVERSFETPVTSQASTPSPKPVVPVPEPSSLILLGAGLLAIGVIRRGVRKR